jgi:hypothetical protein
MINIGFGLHPEMTTNMVVAVTLNTIVAMPTKVLMTYTVYAVIDFLTGS